VDSDSQEPFTVNVTVLFFAQARERAGRAEASIEIHDGGRVADVLERLRRDHPGLAALEPHLAIAVDGVLAGPRTVLTPGAELALLPPVSGG
jgi:molybdopterin synthase catalytic subunit